MPLVLFFEDSEFEVIEISVSDECLQRLNTALIKLEESHSDAQINGLAKALSNHPVGISIEMIEQLSKYCDTGGAWTNCVPYAEYLSRLLVGMVMPRLVDMQNCRLQSFSNDFEQIRMSINAKLAATSEQS